MHLSGPIEQFYIHKTMFQVFNVGVITPWDTSLTNDVLPVFLVFNNIHEYANEVLFI